MLDGRRAGSWAAACGGDVLLVAPFFEWYALDFSGGGWTYYGPPIGGTAWQAFALLDVVLLLVALAPLARLAVPALAAASGALAAVLIGIRVAVPPDPADQLVVERPAWIALAGAVLILAGSLRALLAN